MFTIQQIQNFKYDMSKFSVNLNLNSTIIKGVLPSKLYIVLDKFGAGNSFPWWWYGDTKSGISPGLICKKIWWVCWFLLNPNEQGGPILTRGHFWQDLQDYLAEKYWAEKKASCDVDKGEMTHGEMPLIGTWLALKRFL